jgi:ankyrin repeat protein
MGLMNSKSEIQEAVAVIDSGKIKGNETTGRTVLMITCINGHIDIINMLLDRGALINEIDNDIAKIVNDFLF